MCKSEAPTGERLSNQPVLTDLVSGYAAELAQGGKDKAGVRESALTGLHALLTEHGAVADPFLLPLLAHDRPLLGCRSPSLRVSAIVA